MLIHRHDTATEDEWRGALPAKDFGQLISVAGADGFGIVVPTHFIFDGVDTIELHLARANPIWARLEADPRAMLTVIDAYVYIPTSWNAVPPRTANEGVPTSYYAAVQATGTAAIIDEPADVAEILRRQLGHFQPEGGHAPVDATLDGAYSSLFGAIRGLRITITSVRAKLKFGGNRSGDQRKAIAARLDDRAGPLDAEARAVLLRRLGEDGREP